MAFGNATKGYVKKHSGGGGSGGISTYSELPDKPQINGVTLDGNKTSEDLHITGGGGFDFSNMELIATNPSVSQNYDIGNCNGIVIEFCWHYSNGDTDCDFIILPLEFFEFVGVSKAFYHEWKANTNYCRVNVNSVSNGVYSCNFDPHFESGGRIKVYKF